MLNLSSSTELCKLLADPTRVRLLNLLASEELTVAELTEVTRLPQPRVSTHLRKLREAGLVRDRREGGSSWYALDPTMPADAKVFWDSVSTTLTDPLLTQDRGRAEQVVAQRHGTGTWADSVAGRMARRYSPGRTWQSLARGIVGLVDLGDVLDLGSGDGALSELLASRARSVVCLDISDKVVASGNHRLAHVLNLKFVQGDMHAPPFAPASFDSVLIMNALCFADEPERVLRTAAALLRPGGRLVLVTLRAHAHRDAVARFDHVQLGFEPAQLHGWLEAAGLSVDQCAVTSRERRPPCFEIVTVYAHKARG